MTLGGSRSGAAGFSEKWLLTRGSVRDERLPGNLLLPDSLRDGREWLKVVRVILLVPDVPVHVERLVRLFEALDLPRRTQVILAELVSTHPGRARRSQLDLLLARVQQIYPAAYGEQLYEPDWPSALRAFAGHSDLLIAADQSLAQAVPAGRSLNQVLLNTLNLPILEITGIYPPWPARLVAWIRRGLFQVFPLLVVGLSFWAQSGISGQARGWLSTLAVAASIVVEFALIFFWSLFLD
jgi:hypothetical protein